MESWCYKCVYFNVNIPTGQYRCCAPACRLVPNYRDVLDEWEIKEKMFCCMYEKLRKDKENNRNNNWDNWVALNATAN